MAYYAPRLLGGTVQYDGIDVHYSAQRYLSDELHAGRVPFWTPYVFTGFPFLADIQVAAWYPLDWPFLGLGIVPQSITGELMLHTLIACGGAYTLAVRLLGNPTAAVGVAMFYGLSGWFAAHSEHVGIFQTAAWLPWLIALLDLAGERLSIDRLALAGLLGAGLALPGHFQTALYAYCFGGAAAVLVLATRRGGRRQVMRLGAILAAVAGWGAALAAVMIVPGLELVTRSLRPLVNAQTSAIGFFHVESLLTLVQPDHYGLLSGHYVGPGDSTQHYFYAGLLLVPLAVLGLGERRILLWAACLAIPFLWYAVGPDGGLFRIVARLPGFHNIELPMHGWFLPALGLALLGGAGLLRLPSVWRPVVLGVVFLDTLVVNQLSNPLAYARQSFDSLYDAPLAEFLMQVSNASPPVKRVYGPSLTAVGYRNHALQSRVPTTYGYNPLELAAYATYATAAESNPALVDGLAPTHRWFDDQVQAIPSALPLAFFARQIRTVADDVAADEALSSFDPSSETLVIGSAPPVAEADPRATVTVVSDTAGAITLHYRTASQSLLRVAVADYPGWHARLGNLPLSILRVDRAFIGVVVPSGEGDVRLTFAPRLFWPSLAISVLALGACGLVLSRRVVRRFILRATHPER